MLFHTFFLQGPNKRGDTTDQVAGLELGHLKSQGPLAPSLLPDPAPGLPQPAPRLLQLSPVLSDCTAVPFSTLSP